MQLGHPLRDGQPQPDAVGRAGPEPPGAGVQRPVGHAGAAVLDLHRGLGDDEVDPGRLGPDPAVPDGVAGQVLDGDPDQGRVAVEHGGLHLDGHGVRSGHGLGDRLLGELVEPERLALQGPQAGHHPGPGEQRLHGVGEPLGGPQHLAQRVGLLLRVLQRRLRQGAHHGQRGAQLVRGVGEEVLLLADRLDRRPGAPPGQQVAAGPGEGHEDRAADDQRHGEPLVGELTGTGVGDRDHGAGDGPGHAVRERHGEQLHPVPAGVGGGRGHLGARPPHVAGRVEQRVGRHGQPPGGVREDQVHIGTAGLEHVHGGGTLGRGVGEQVVQAQRPGVVGQQRDGGAGDPAQLGGGHLAALFAVHDEGDRAHPGEPGDVEDEQQHGEPDPEGDEPAGGLQVHLRPGGAGTALHIDGCRRP